ncbi:type VI secretion system baseplate subunit TssE [Niveibacterium sp. SC-1]|uniref:type VI secretion system baseplate subunit TssE n=1 Tax=Niveibacterium sp. SC-1 TaxID=3135646 RepID=UPI00311DD650
MAGFDPTLFERLFDAAPHRPHEDTPLRRWNTEQLKESVARDLESLLNTRAFADTEALAPFPEAARSLASYGMTDFVGMSLANPADRDRICRTLERAIARHEPRLRQVLVILETDRNAIGCLQFGIRAVLQVSSSAEPVSFDALLQPDTLQYAVSKSRHASLTRSA